MDNSLRTPVNISTRPLSTTSRPASITQSPAASCLSIQASRRDDPYHGPYTYAAGNPVSRVDSSGRCAETAGPQPEKGFCVGAVTAGSLGLVGIGVIDTGVGIAKLLVDWTVFGAIAMVPVDVGAIYAARYTATIVNQGANRNLQ